jgi:cbb3-type cytochrome c oxidase subunit III
MEARGSFYMNTCLLLAVIICLVLSFDNTVPDHALQNTNRAAATPTNKVKEAKTLFKTHCVKCHGADGRGRTVEGEIAGAQDFTDQDWQQRVKEQRIINSITHGRGQMPAFEKKLGKDQIKSLAALVRTFND